MRVCWGESSCRRECKSDVQPMGSTHRLQLQLYYLGAGEASGIAGVAEKCVDVRRNTSGEGGLLDSN